MMLRTVIATIALVTTVPASAQPARTYAGEAADVPSRWRQASRREERRAFMGVGPMRIRYQSFEVASSETGEVRIQTYVAPSAADADRLFATFADPSAAPAVDYLIVIGSTLIVTGHDGGPALERHLRSRGYTIRARYDATEHQ